MNFRGRTLRLACVMLAAIVSCFLSKAVADEPSSSFFPFTIPLEKNLASVVDASSWLEAPAGKSGFVAVKDGHFFAGEKRIKFWGTNIAFGGVFPDAETAPLLADKMARFGINVVRIHSADIIDGRPSLIDRAVKDTQHLNAENLDKLDRLVSELKKRGVYTNINLHVNRNFTAEDEVTDAETLPMFSKNITLFDRRMIELQKKYAHDLLTHVNPYTGLAYANDPGIAFVEVTNENSFFYGWYSSKLDNLPPSYAAQLDAAWMTWLRAHYQSTADLEAAWKQKVPAGESLEAGKLSRPAYKDKTRSTECVSDYLACLWEIEHAYFQEMHDYLKNDLAVKMPVTGTMFFTMAGGMIQADTMDFVDMHAYWQHPDFAAEWKGKWSIRNTPMVESDTTNTLTWLGAARVADKPFTVSEFNEPWPNFYEAEGIPLVAAWAARQDWDGVYLFNYNGNGEFRRDKVYSWFDIDGHPVKMAQMIAGAAIFTRGDLGPAESSRTATISRGAALKSSVKFGWNRGEEALKSLGWDKTNTIDQRWGLKFLLQDEGITTTLGDVVTSGKSAREFRWQDGAATLAAPRSRFFIARGGMWSKSGSVGITMLDGGGEFGVVTMTSLDAEPHSIAQSQRTLIIAGGQTSNAGMEWEAGNHYATAGAAPALTEGVAARIIMMSRNGPFYKLFALDPSGAKLSEVPSHDPQGRVFDLGPQYRTIWYLLERRE
ncbi:hypothetical protein BH09SUM1_BH09SUM1_15880 [soil metagenome]